MAERALRTILGMIYKRMTILNTFKWFTDLDKLQMRYNSTPKRSINFMTPNEVISNPEKASQLKRFYGEQMLKHHQKYSKQPSYNVGDTVRYLLKKENIFSKSYAPSFSSDTAKIVRVLDSSPPVFFLNNKYPKRPYYSSELTKSWPDNKPRIKDLYVASFKLVEGRKLRSGKRSAQKKLYLIKSRQKKAKPFYANEQEKHDLEKRGLL